MRRLLFIILTATVYFSAISICRADDLISDISPSQAHMQLVNQELDQVESTGNNRAVTSVNNNRSTVSPFPRDNQIVSPSSFLIPKNNEFVFSSESYWAKFDEPKIVDQKGFMSGYNAQFTHRIANHENTILNVFRLEGQWASGKFKTEPIDQGPSGIKVDTYDIRGILGKDSYTIAHVRATGYFGFGYRYLEDNAEGLNIDSGGFTLLGYKSYSHYCYLPVGVDMVYQTRPAYSLEGNFEYDYVVHNWEVAKLGVVPGYNTLDVNQRGGNGLRASLRLNLNFKYCTAFMEWFYRYWNITKSKSEPDPFDPSVGINEPKNNTEEFGLRLGLQI